MQALDLGNHRGRAVDRVRAVIGIACVASLSVNLDAQVRSTARADDGLQVGWLRGHTA
jgi:hypothetical protein